MELEQTLSAESKTREVAQGGFLKILIGGLLLGLAGYIATNFTNSYELIIAAAIGGYMAMNIGANDVANNVGPSVGAKVLTLGGAIAIAALFEASGALIAGGDVVETVRKGIIDPAMISNTNEFVWLMMGALLAGALWLNLATSLGAPVSTTHSIVGGVLGAGLAAAYKSGATDWFYIVNWAKMGQIAMSWVASPVMGAVIAAIFLYFIKRTVMYRPDILKAAKTMVPILVALMAWAFVTYLMMKGLKKIFPVEVSTAALIGFVAAIITYALMYVIVRKNKKLTADKESVNKLFRWPLIVAVAFLSFAHGANDVANSIGPLAAINDMISHPGALGSKAAIPLWVMIIGAGGIAAGLWLFGPKLIRTVGSEITEMDPTRAFCIAMAAAITVIIASQAGIPVSTTHIAVGAVFGIGFLREYLKGRYQEMIDDIEHHHQGEDREKVETFLEEFRVAGIEQRGEMLSQLKAHTAKAELTKKERRELGRMYKKQLVKREAVYKIAAAWVITVPASGVLAAVCYFTIRGMIL